MIRTPRKNEPGRSVRRWAIAAPLLMMTAVSPQPWTPRHALLDAIFGSTPAAAQAANASGRGTVNNVNTADRKINISHEAIPALSWPAMTMDVPVSPAVDLSKVQPGAKIQFSLSRGSAGYVIDGIRPAQ